MNSIFFPASEGSLPSPTSDKGTPPTASMPLPSASDSHHGSDHSDSGGSEALSPTLTVLEGVGGTGDYYQHVSGAGDRHALQVSLEMLFHCWVFLNTVNRERAFQTSMNSPPLGQVFEGKEPQLVTSSSVDSGQLTQLTTRSGH